MKILVGLSLFVAMILAGDVPAAPLPTSNSLPGISDHSALTQGGAVVALAWVVWLLLGELRDNRKERIETTAAFAEALNKLREHCAVKNARDD